MKPELRDQMNREKREYQIWAAGFMAKLRRVESLTMTHRYIADFIGTITRDGAYWRLTTWRPNGPNGHELYNDDQLSHEVHRAWWIDPSAPARLDSWVGTPEWQRGMLQIDYLELWNGFSAKGKYDLCHAMDDLAFGPGGLEAGIKFGKENQTV